MSVFGNYARYYDLLYRDKDYGGEAEYIAGLIERFAPDADTILELGCGTGKHAELLARRGYALLCMDRSLTMLDRARERIASLEQGERIEVREGDVRDFSLGRRFDAVISLFHVVSYVTANADVRSLLRCVREHLNPGGVFVFDVWYGPAVLTLKPEVRVLRLEDEAIDVTRIAEPDLHINENVVDVNYEILVRDKRSGALERHEETHRMRYAFRPELDLLLDEAGLKLVHGEEWMTGRAPGADTWGVCFVAKG